MTDTDSKMMRIQQGKDTGVHVEPDETHARKEEADTDAASAAARDAATGGHAVIRGDAEDAVLEQNKRSQYSKEADVFEDGKAHKTPPLAGKDRSLLGS